MGLGLVWVWVWVNTSVGSGACLAGGWSLPGQRKLPRTSRACRGEDPSQGAQDLLPRSVVGQGGKGTGTLRENQINSRGITVGKSN